jgi:hypothetical protein
MTSSPASDQMRRTVPGGGGAARIRTWRSGDATVCVSVGSEAIAAGGAPMGSPSVSVASLWPCWAAQQASWLRQPVELSAQHGCRVAEGWRSWSQRQITVVATATATARARTPRRRNQRSMNQSAHGWRLLSTISRERKATNFEAVVAVWQEIPELPRRFGKRRCASHSGCASDTRPCGVASARLRSPAPESASETCP